MEPNEQRMTFEGAVKRVLHVQRAMRVMRGDDGDIGDNSTVDETASDFTVEHQSPIDLALHKLLTRERSVTKAVFDKYLDPATARASLVAADDARWDAPSMDDGQEAFLAHRSVCGIPVLSERSRVLRTWVALIFLVDATYTAFLLPCMISFRLFGRDGVWLDTAIGVVLGVEIFVNFHSTVILTNGFRRVVLTNGRAIGHYYLRNGTFFFDVIAFLPTILVPLASYLDSRRFVAAARALRLVRLYRVVNLVRVMFSSNLLGTSTSTLQLVGMYVLDYAFAIGVLVNLLACFWFSAGTSMTKGHPALHGWLAQNYKFQGPTDTDACNQFVTEQETLYGMPADEVAGACDSLWFASNTGTRYLTSLYYVFTTITTVGYGDITPSSFVEVGVAVVIMLAGLVGFGLLINSVATLIATYTISNSQKNRALRDRLASAQSWMDQNAIPRHLRKQVSRFYTRSWVDRTDTSENDILDELPQSLRARTIYHLLKPSLNLMPSWSHFREDLFLALCGRMHSLSLSTEQDLIRQGDPCDRLYFLVEGTVRAFSSRSLVPVALIPSPCCIGDVAILSQDSPDCKQRLNSYQTYTPCKFWTIDVADIWALEGVLPELRPALVQAIAKRFVQRVEDLTPRQATLLARYLRLTQLRRASLADIVRAEDAVLAALDASLLQCFYSLDLAAALSGRVAARAAHQLPSFAAARRGRDEAVAPEATAGAGEGRKRDDAAAAGGEGGEGGGRLAEPDGAALPRHSSPIGLQQSGSFRPGAASNAALLLDALRGVEEASERASSLGRPSAAAPGLSGVAGALRNMGRWLPHLPDIVNDVVGLKHASSKRSVASDAPASERGLTHVSSQASVADAADDGPAAGGASLRHVGSKSSVAAAADEA